MKNQLTLAWLSAAVIRALKTIAQTMLGMITVGAAIGDIKWLYVLSVAAVAGACSLLTSIVTTLPEIATDGVMSIDSSNPNKDIYKLELSDQLETLSTKKTVTFTINANADLSQK